MLVKDMSQQSLAITEKRAAPGGGSGGCAAVLFQLLNWNRRITAKKKLFSKKLLPSARAAKWVSNKFSADEKVSKSNCLSNNEDKYGRIPTVRDMPGESPAPSAATEMRSPGLVPRLMGLESMPIVHDEPRKALDITSLEEINKYSRLDQDLCFGNPRNDEITRPQKIQRIGGFLERRSPFVRSKKPLQHKLITPLKSPRTQPRRSTARLLEVASKFLEPGLQSRNRQKYAITYDDEIVRALPKNERNDEQLNDLFVGSCRNCGGLVEVGELRFGNKKKPLVDENCSSVIDVGGTSTSFNVKIEVPLVVQSKTDVQNTFDVSSRRRNAIRDIEIRSKQRKAGPLNSTLSLNVGIKQHQLPVAKERACTTQKNRRDPNELNKSKTYVSSHVKTPPKAPVNQRVGKSRNVRQKDMGQKRRPTSDPTTKTATGNPAIIESNSIRRYPSTQGISRLASNSSSLGRSLKTEAKKEVRKDDMVSFVFDSPTMRDTRLSASKVAEGRSEKNAIKLVSNTRNGDVAPRIGFNLTGESLSNFLDHKIRELVLIEKEDQVTKSVFQQQSTASILDELVSAVISEEPECQKNTDSCSAECSAAHELSRQEADVSGCSHYYDNEPASNSYFQKEANKDMCVLFSASEVDHQSPMSVLGVSFSNDGSFSDTCNGSVGYETLSEVKESKCNKEQLSDAEKELLDSATSHNQIESNFPSLSDSSISENHIYDNNLWFTEIVNCKSMYARDAILTVQMFLETMVLVEHGVPVQVSLLGLLQTTMASFLEDNSEVSEMKFDHIRALFDCMIECLESRYNLLCRFGFEHLLNLTLWPHKSKVIKQIHEELRGWKDMAGISLNDLIEIEINQSSRKWKDCVAEVFEMGVDIGSNILQLLINEMVTDFC